MTGAGTVSDVLKHIHVPLLPETECFGTGLSENAEWPEAIHEKGLLCALHETHGGQANSTMDVCRVSKKMSN